MKVLGKYILIKGYVKEGHIIKVKEASTTQEVEKTVIEMVGLNVNDPNDSDINIEPGKEVLVNPLKLFDIAFNVNKFFPKKKDNEFYIVAEKEDILLIK